MTKIESEEVIKFLGEKWKNAVCPLCGGQQWEFSDRVFGITELKDSNLIMGRTNALVCPAILVTCQNCGNTVLINALTAGVLKDG